MKTDVIPRHVWLGSNDANTKKAKRETLHMTGLLQKIWLVTSTLLLLVVGLPRAQADSFTIVATGLNNPRGLAFGPNGNLYVAEAGLGAGDGQGGFKAGIGFTGSITVIQNAASPNPIVRRMVRGLASVGGTEHGFPEVVGADGISVQSDGGIFVIMSESSKGLALNPGDPAATQFGYLLQGGTLGAPHVQWKAIADVGNFNFDWTNQHQNDPFAPPGQFPDANPYSVLALPGHQYVADAGANTLNEVRSDGSIRIVAYLPNPPQSDAVPTCVAQGPDGLLYVGTLGAQVPGQGQVFRVNPNLPDIQYPAYQDAWASDFTGITGCGFGPGGFYVVEFTAGDIVRIAINPDGTAGARTQLGAGALNQPNGFVAGPDGSSVYVSNFSTSSGGGQVVRIDNVDF